MGILGEALLDDEDALHGWCLHSADPLARLTIDILADGAPIASVAATRFREDAAQRGLGDGYCGFSIRLARQLAARPSVLAAAERATGQIFWQKTLRPIPLPARLPERLAALRGQLAALAQSPALAPAAGPAAFATALGAIGGALTARPRATQPVTLPAAAAPALSLILDAAPATLPALRRAAGALAAAPVEIILTDAGADPEILTAQSAFTNLIYLRAPGANAAQRRNLAAQAARGRMLVFLRGPAGLDAPACAALAAAPTLLIPPGLAAALARIAPRFAALPAAPGAGRPDFWAAIPAAARAAIGWFDPRMDDGAGLDIADFLLRAATRAPLAIWRPAIAPPPFTWPTPADPAAGPHFAANWTQTAQ